MNDCLVSAQQSLRIHSIHLKESKIFVRDDFELSAFDRSKTKAQTFRSVTSIKEISLVNAEEKELWDYRFMYAVGIRLIFSKEEGESDKDDYKPIVEIFGVFEAKYFSEQQLQEDELKAFSKNNVGYHVWPFWREYVQSSCARIGFYPSFEVPVYIISQTKKGEE